VPLEAVSWAEGLTVRVVNNVNKLQEVKANFHDAFKGDNFPSSLPYRQKVRRRSWIPCQDCPWAAHQRPCAVGGPVRHRDLEALPTLCYSKPC
jgi:hypothetical protein